MIPYAQQLLDPRWLAVRKQVLEREWNRCQECRTPDGPLHVHHTYYAKGRMAWDYDLASLKCLCARCHLEIEQQLVAVRSGMHQLNAECRGALLGYMQTLIDRGTPQIDATEMIRKMFPGEDPATMFDDYREEEPG